MISIPVTFLGEKQENCLCHYVCCLGFFQGLYVAPKKDSKKQHINYANSGKIGSLFIMTLSLPAFFAI